MVDGSDPMIPPPVMIIRIPLTSGSFGYGAKVDGNKICIPYNPSVIKHLQESGVEMQFTEGVRIPMNVTTMHRMKFNSLPNYQEPKVKK